MENSEEFSFHAFSEESKQNNKFFKLQEEEEKRSYEKKYKKNCFKLFINFIWECVCDFFSYLWKKIQFYLSQSKESGKEEVRVRSTLNEILLKKRSWAPPLIYSILTIIFFIMIFPSIISIIRSYKITIYTDSLNRSILKPFVFENSSNTWSMNYDIFEENIYSWNANKNKDKKLFLTKKELEQGYFTTEVYKEFNRWNVSIELLKNKMKDITKTRGCANALQLGIPYSIMYIKDGKDSFYMANPEVESFYPELTHVEFKFKFDEGSEGEKYSIVYARDIPDTIRLKWLDPLIFPLSPQSKTFDGDAAICSWIMLLKTT
jgi:hypothetical protein